MSDTALHPGQLHDDGGASRTPHMGHPPSTATIVIFLALLIGGIGYAVYSVFRDVNAVGGEPLAIGAFVLLAVALVIALGFEFVNGFHDTANAVATVIYTHALPANAAVLWSGMWNFIGVVTSSGTVAYSIVSLLPVELILRVGSGAGYAMIFSLLIAAIIWNLGTWSLGLPASSTHTLVGSIVGVGLANQFLAHDGASGVDWSQLWGVVKALLISPVVGFVCAGALCWVAKRFIKNKALWDAPDGAKPPPPVIRGLLVLTCTGVSFAHGSNDGQKGMGLIMLILIGVLPTAYALNQAMPSGDTPAFVTSMTKAHDTFAAHGGGAAPATDAANATIIAALRDHSYDKPEVYGALATMATDIGHDVQQYGAVNKVPAAAVKNIRNEMYMASEVAKDAAKGHTLTDADKAVVGDFRKNLDAGTRFIPLWVKVAVAIALGLGTMVGWKRIVVTVGEKIGKTHLTYGQGAAAELIAAATILAADRYGAPVSTTHVLSSGIAGTMAANGSGLQWDTLRNIALAWVLTLPAAAIISGILFTILRQVF